MKVQQAIVDAIHVVDALVENLPNTMDRLDWKRVKTEIKKRNLNLCDVCVNEYPNCPAMLSEDKTLVQYGTVYNDNIYSCTEYIPVVVIEENNTNK